MNILTKWRTGIIGLDLLLDVRNIRTVDHSKLNFSFLDLKSNFIKYTTKVMTQHQYTTRSARNLGFIFDEHILELRCIPPFTLTVKQPAPSLPPVTGGSRGNPTVSGQGPLHGFVPIQSDSLAINFDIRHRDVTAVELLSCVFCLCIKQDARITLYNIKILLSLLIFQR